MADDAITVRLGVRVDGAMRHEAVAMSAALEMVRRMAGSGLVGDHVGVLVVCPSPDRRMSGGVNVGTASSYFSSRLIREMDEKALAAFVGETVARGMKDLEATRPDAASESETEVGGE